MFSHYLFQKIGSQNINLSDSAYCSTLHKWEPHRRSVFCYRNSSTCRFSPFDTGLDYPSRTPTTFNFARVPSSNIFVLVGGMNRQSRECVTYAMRKPYPDNTRYNAADRDEDVVKGWLLVRASTDRKSLVILLCSPHLLSDTSPADK